MPPAMTASTDREHDPGVVHEPDEVVAVEGEPGVVERRDRVEHPVPQGLAPRVVVAGPEAHRQDGGEDGLEGEHGDGDAADHVPHVADVERVRLGLGDERRLQPQLAADEHAPAVSPAS